MINVGKTNPLFVQKMVGENYVVDLGVDEGIT
jgi:hypothetical protein